MINSMNKINKKGGRWENAWERGYNFNLSV